MPTRYRGLDDTPIFRREIQLQAQTTDELERRLNRIYKASVRYKDALKYLSSSQEEFSGALSECRTVDQSSAAQTGNEQLQTLATGFQTLAQLSDMVCTQHEHTLCEVLDQLWLKGHLPAAKASRKQMERTATEADKAQNRYLGNDFTGRFRRERSLEQTEVARADAEHAQGIATESRIACARQYTTIEAEQLHAFLNAVCSTIQSHVSYTRRCAEAMRSLEGSAAGAAETVQVQQQAAARRLEDFDSEVGRYCSQRQARQQRHGHPQQQQQQRVDDMCNPDHLAQMYAPAIMASCTQEGAEVVALRQGSLMKRNRTLLRSWDRRFFTLDSAAVLAYHSLRHQPSNGLRVRQASDQQSTKQVSLLSAQVGPDVSNDPSRLFAFSISSPEGVLELQAENAVEQAEWIAALQAVIQVAQSQGLTYSLNAAHGPGLSQPSPQASTDGSLLNTMGSDTGVQRHQAQPSMDGMADFLDLDPPAPQPAAFPQYPPVAQHFPGHPQHAHQVSYPTIEPPAPNGSPIWGLGTGAHRSPDPPAPSRFADASAQAPHAAPGGGIWLGGTQQPAEGPSLKPSRHFAAQMGERTPSASSLDGMPLAPGRHNPPPAAQPQPAGQAPGAPGGLGLSNRLGGLRQPMQDILRKVRPERENTPPPGRDATPPDPNRQSPVRRPRPTRTQEMAANERVVAELEARLLSLKQ